MEYLLASHHNSDPQNQNNKKTCAESQPPYSAPNLNDHTREQSHHHQSPHLFFAQIQNVKIWFQKSYGAKPSNQYNLPFKAPSHYLSHSQKESRYDSTGASNSSRSSQYPSHNEKESRYDSSGASASSPSSRSSPSHFEKQSSYDSTDKKDSTFNSIAKTGFKTPNREVIPGKGFNNNAVDVYKLSLGLGVSRSSSNRRIVMSICGIDPLLSESIQKDNFKSYSLIKLKNLLLLN
ncbi:hypothetical protein DICPUDRAFT_83904 [Dictyostelium purpureum]|uniref:Uncharacterized protein n=1 Tax=Dictyostelium purpureum TaxID=5786 RepID=F1A0Z5_DICPU|nr:uncharacterized protein DICPUDRAFT_83904 [Dictyostelium purpureum]EGC30130.1 hypothetical protein DICPUDRAFT_83904 [Dictyostelium purpureum]|eukprot:XP_003293338.1 hypothetical protein DICPUDRAFT_83904 [Dictyostelium purpureum]